MVIYCETVNTFIDNCNGSNPIIGKILLDKFKEHKLGGVSTSEYHSWINSLPKIAECLDDESINKSIYVGVEYNLIDTKQRIDFLIYGKDENDLENVILVELKQWSSVKRSNLQDFVFTDGGAGYNDYWHPSYQALNYSNIMKYFNEYIYTNNVKVNACSYLHNMNEGYDVILNDFKSYPLVHYAPTFLKDDKEKLREFINKYIKKPYKNTLYEIDGSNIRPSEGFAKMVSDAIKGNPFFSFDQEQSFSVSKIVNEVNEAIIKGERRTIIIRGGAGTGKSIVAINALGRLLYPNDGSKRKNACYLTANFTPRTYFSEILIKDFSKRVINEIFKKPAAFARCSSMDYDCIIVDEAHRMFNWKFGQGITKDIDLIDKVFNASRVNVFLIDDKQAVTVTDNLCMESIIKYAEKYGSKVIKDERLHLTSQFRCIGGAQYIEFVKKILGYKNDFKTLKNTKYKVEVLDSMSEMIDIFEEETSYNHIMRLLAGYTKDHPWNKGPDEFNFEYPKDNVYLKWNDTLSNKAAFLDESQKDRVFCIHTVQGLEVEYAGVIITKDLTYNEEKDEIEFHPKENLSIGVNGVKMPSKEKQIELIRNTYNVLLTRGTKGTYIYCEDKPLGEYIKRVLKY